MSVRLQAHAVLCAAAPQHSRPAAGLPGHAWLAAACWLPTADSRQLQQTWQSTRQSNQQAEAEHLFKARSRVPCYSTTPTKPSCATWMVLFGSDERRPHLQPTRLSFHIVTLTLTLPCCTCWHQGCTAGGRSQTHHVPTAMHVCKPCQCTRTLRGLGGLHAEQTPVRADITITQQAQNNTIAHIEFYKQHNEALATTNPCCWQRMAALDSSLAVQEVHRCCWWRHGTATGLHRTQ
ncbi:hypothetical protein COO60DRAFT_887671 [Scenedesmus sp. NREL 46B-D3]|nr:hypothetical protein COO60DRAFT_887671 [Scenedesmus sp. NREL 46B-D3]